MNTTVGFNRFINSQLLTPKHFAAGDSGLTKCITISRQAGCGAYEFGEELAARLQVLRPNDKTPWTVFDHSLVAAVLQDHHLPSRLAAFMPEDRTTQMEEIVHDLFSLHPAPEIMVRQTAETILRLAELSHVIIVGRGGNIITARLPQMLHVRLIGSVEKRAARLQMIDKLDEKEALARIARIDKGRCRYVKRYFRKDVNSPLHYHLVLNTDLLALRDAAAAVAEFALSHHLAAASASVKAAA